MLNIKDLNKTNLKEAAGLKSVTDIFQTKGSFAFGIVNKKDEEFDMSGYIHNKTGKISYLRIARHTQLGFAIPDPTLKETIKILSRLNH